MTGDTDERPGGAIEQFVQRHPWVDRVSRTGWLSRGLVYTVFGLLAIPVAFQNAPAQDEASPSGAIGRIADIPAGPVLLLVMVAGMALYIVFQLLSLLLIDERGPFGWWRRGGHLVAAAMYTLFAWSCARVALYGASTGGSLVERLSRSVLDTTGGRWLVGVAGVSTMIVGAYFGHRHVVHRGFAEGLTSVDDDPSGEPVINKTLLVIGVVGWFGRSAVIGLIGFFLVRAAWTFDPTEARGFDRALREAADSRLGSVLVVVSALGLLTYGIFCVASHPRRTVRDNESSAGT